MHPDDLQTLRTSPDGLVLKETMLKVLKAPQPGDVDLLARALGNEAFLLRLDDAESYQTTVTRLRLNKIVRALGDARSAECHGALLELTAHPIFVAHPLRVKMLILGLSNLEPMQPEALAFWRKHARPESSLATDVALATMQNLSDGALQLFGAMIADDGHARSLRISWLRRFLLPVRDDYPVLELAERMLDGGLSPPMQQKLLEVLFQFKPDRWYKSCRHPEPPDRLLASGPSKALLRNMAVRALAGNRWPDDLRDALEDVRDRMAQEADRGRPPR